ncbi:MAG: hypothetical protein LBO63_01865 [Oscillospiraceae bacterium]|jgi:TPP-dependent indolepyruvate ferredoxin oxidoreductase alpha subunit|nr:hypothetical protein [Oscillospiraceae bacterium]
MTPGNIVLYAVLALVLALGIIALVRGVRGVRAVKSPGLDRKTSAGLAVVSVLHAIAGGIVILCFIIAGVLLLISYLRGR